MLKKIVNEAFCTLRITTTGPLLVKSGHASVSGPDSRGLGQVKAEISTDGSHGRPGGFVTSTIRDSGEHENQLWGLGRWLNNESYGTSPDDFITVDVERITRGIRTMRSFAGDDLNNLRDLTIDVFVKRMQTWSGEHMQEFAPVSKRQ